MIKRIVDISQPSHIHLRLQQLVIEQEGREVGLVPLEDLGVLILDHPAISHTQMLFAECCRHNIAVLFSDEKHLPVSVLLPLTGGALHSKTISLQTNVTAPVCKRLWQAVMKAKISEQARVLRDIHGDDRPLPMLVKQVLTGDPGNVEGKAARIYWRKLFGKDFRRDRDQPGVNSLLNYGYAVIRAAVARSIVGTGLHPALGLHHHNQYDSLCLADDLMEPLRPAVDWKVFHIREKLNSDEALTPELKREILTVLGISCRVGKQTFPLIPALHHYAASARKAICGEGKRLKIPAVDFPKKVRI